jgi:PAS domain S-box-containing protein
MRDLVALSALPAVWAGYQPLQVAESLAEVLLSTLRLDLVYIRLLGQTDGQEIEVARTAGGATPSEQTRDIGRALAPWLDGAGIDSAPPLPNLEAPGTVRVVAVPIGCGRPEGVLVAGSRQTAFPSEEDRLLLSMAANQAAAVFQRERDEKALRASEQRFRTFVDHATEAFFLHDEQGRILDVNRQACESLGYTRDELVGMVAFDFDPDVTPAGLEEFGPTLDGGGTIAFESRHRRKDGTVFPVEIRGQGFCEGGRRFMVSLARDITDRKRVEKALRESEERLRNYFELSLTAMAITAPGKTWLQVNEPLCILLGYRWEELRTRTWAELTHPDDLAADLAQFERMLRGEIDGYSLEKRFVRQNGEVVHTLASVRAVRRPDGPVDYCLAQLLDITGLKQIEQELREAKEAEAERARLAELGRDVGIALSQGDTLRELLQPCAEAMMRYLDAAFARVWWLPPGKDVLELQASAGMYTHLDGPHARIPIGQLKIGRIAQERRPLLTNAVQADPSISDPSWARREGMVAFAGYPLVVKDRLLGVLAMFSHRPLSEAVLQTLASVAGVIALGIERKQQQVELRRAKEAAEAANRAKDEFLANVSHEIRTPFGAILGMTELVLDTPLTDNQRQCLKTVKSAADNLLGIINDLLDFAKIEAGKLELYADDFSLRTVVGDTLRALAVRAHTKGLELIYHVQPEVPDALVGDAGRLRQVLLNLVGNAIKFTDDGEVVVHVQAAGSEDDKVARWQGDKMTGSEDDKVTSLQGDKVTGQDMPPVTLSPGHLVTLSFQVRDTGIGIPLDKQQSIFRAFEQEDTSTTRKYGGTGLGLTISARLVALMGGQISVQSAAGRGSTFAFTARFGLQPHPAEPATARPPVVLRNLPVLIVDDNATNRHILQEWLRDWQMEAEAVGDAAAAMDTLWHRAANGRPYALVLLDARMPDRDGLTVAAMIRERTELSTTRLILLTSGERPGDPARSRELRIDAFLRKPVQQEELLETIYRVMSRATERMKDEGGRMKEDKKSASGSDSSLIPHPSSLPLNILVAEDNEFSARLMEQLLTRGGHRVRLATNGREALALLGIGDQKSEVRGQKSEVRGQKSEGGANEELTSLTSDLRPLTSDFDLLLLDIHMPGLDGFGVVGAIREREHAAGGHLPVIALTARSRKEDRERCLAAGIDDFLTKPVPTAALFAAINRLVYAQRDSRPNQADAGERRSLLDPVAVLTACGDDAEGLHRMCQDFQTYAPARLAEMIDALRDRDAPRLRRAAHKSCALLFAFSTVAGNVASNLEDLATQGQLEEAQSLVEQLVTMTNELMQLVGGLSLEAVRQQAEACGDRQPAGQPSRQKGADS